VTQTSRAVNEVGYAEFYSRERVTSTLAIARLEWVVFSYEIMLRWAAGPLPILSRCYVAPTAHLIRTLTSNRNLSLCNLLCSRIQKKKPPRQKNNFIKIT